jgi:diguanylate cyclase (GGDEF)-like protein/PAS domain S-box-containing protein
MNLDTQSNRQVFRVRITKLKCFSQRISLAVALVGSLVIVGWVFDIAVLKSILPEKVTMKANAAVCFIFAGISLRLWHQRAAIAPIRHIAQGLAVLVSLIGGLTLMEYGLSADFGIDQLLFRAMPEVGAPMPGRMAIHTAWNFLLVGASLLLLHCRRPKYLLIQGLTCLVSLSAFLALLGYLYSTASLYDLGAIASFPFNAAITFLLLSGGLLLARPDRGVMSIFIEETIGGILARRLFPAGILVPTLVCWLSLLGERQQLYSPDLGICFLSIANVLIFSGLVWGTARILSRIDRQRQRAEQALQQVAIDLEQRVERRTASLQVAHVQLQAEMLTSQAAQQEQQRAEEKLRQSEQRFRALFEQAPFGVTCFTPAGDLIQVNLAWEEIWATSRETATGYNILQDTQLEAIGHIAEIQRAFTGETVTLPADVYNPAAIGREGRSRWIEPSFYAIKDAAGIVQEVVLISKDITDSKLAEDALQQSEERLRLVLEASQLGTWYYDLETKQILWSERCRILFGFTSIQSSYSAFEEQLHPEERDRVNHAVAAAIANRADYDIECRVVWQDGSIHWVAIKGCAFYTSDGKPFRMLGVASDITDRKQVEGALQQLAATLELKVAERTAELTQLTRRLQRESVVNKLAAIALQEKEELYRTIVNVLAEGVTVQDCDGAILTTNASAEQILGLSNEQMTGRSSLDPGWQAIHADGSLFPGEQHPAMVALRTGEPCANVIMGVHKPDGSLTWISINSQPLIRPAERQPYAVVTSFSDITDLKLAENTLQESEAELRALFAAMTDVVLVRNAQGRCLKIAPTNPINLYRPAAEMIGKTPQESLPPHPANIIQTGIQQALKEQQPSEGEYSLTIQEQEVHFSAIFSPISPNAVVIVARNITERKQAEAELFHEKELAQVTLQSIGDAVITTDAIGQVRYLNPVAESLTGWSQAEAQGLPLQTVFCIVNETTRLPVANPIEEALRKGQIVGLANHTVLIARDGNEFAIDDSAAPIRASDGQVIGAVLVFHDVTATRSLTHQLFWQASHDALTGLVNRREFESRLKQAVGLAKAENQRHALCYLDLDQFKIVNDTCGHAAGDELLRQVTALLQTQIRKTDMLARLGGDEFGILLNQCLLEEAQKVANTLREKIHSFRFIWNGKQFAIGVSIGLVVIDCSSENAAKILSAADAACYVSKNKGRNRVHVYQANDLELVRQQGEMQWVTQLTQALEEDRFCLYYQTIVPTIAQPFAGEHYEVLLRLKDESGNLVPPMAFIPAAERYNLMHKIDRWVIRTLFATQSQHYRDVWSRCQTQNCGCSYLYAVNLSGASINDDSFIDFLHEQFELHQIPPQLICFEITETVAISNLSKAAQFINGLRDLGCRFALDDFGSGMSSFGYLKNLPIDYLKIDGSFIKHIVDDPIDSVIVEAIKQVGQAMGIQTIAEFVENDAILDKVRLLGVNYAQGYGIATPCPFTCN